LTGSYFAARDFANRTRTRLDPTVNFDWRLGAPTGASLPAPDHFSVRWRGQVQPRFSGPYTFHTFADDGVRVWVNDRKIIDNWQNQAATATQGTIPLVAGRRYDIRVDYYEFDKTAQLLLAWSGPRQPFEVIPTRQLYPASAPPKSASKQAVSGARKQP
jgi:hypothetical protein